MSDLSAGEQTGPGRPVLIDGATLTPAGVVGVARDRTRVEVGPTVRARLDRERAVVDTYVDDQIPAYGVTTGLGARSTVALAREDLSAFSARTLRGRANAVGTPLAAHLVRAAMVARANGIASGHTGASPAVLDSLVGMLNAGVHPVVPESGSIGSSDLCLMAHVGLVVMGEGRAECGGELLDGATALRRAGQAPLALGPKDGLVLCGASPVAAGTGALAVGGAAATLTMAQGVAALTLEGFRGNSTPLDPRAQAARPAPGQTLAAAELRALLDGGALTDSRSARRLQDPVSLRCVAPVHGALHAAVTFAATAVDAELNGSGDNPIVDAESAQVLSTGNFHTPVLALALDTLALALCQTAALSAARTGRLMSPALTGLSANLSPRGLDRSGMAPVVKTAQALVAEIRHLAAPVSIDSRSGAEGVEDDSTNACLGARRLLPMLDKLRLVLAIEATAASQAVDLAAPATLGRGAAVLHRAVRAVVAPLDDDRALGSELERVAIEVLASLDVQADLDAIVRAADAGPATGLTASSEQHHDE
ncbi:MAG TPA: aromatic amino acid lyase [Nocardioidaceae bacterium]|nr:aromatic amino acid lyase [Nocardioidaceae bacterium]